MNQSQPIDLNPAQVQQAAAAVVRFLSLDTTLIPGNIKGQVSVIAAVLVGIANGQLQVVPAVQDGVRLDNSVERQQNSSVALAEAKGADSAATPD